MGAAAGRSLKIASLRRLVTEKRTRIVSPKERELSPFAESSTRERELIIHSEDGDPPAGSLVAGAALASSAIIAEGVQIAGTASLLYLGQQYTGSSGPVEVCLPCCTASSTRGPPHCTFLSPSDDLRDDRLPPEPAGCRVCALRRRDDLLPGYPHRCCVCAHGEPHSAAYASGEEGP